ncbi:MAG: long-chain-fatty-acid--CoA ligase [Syntrophobacterales bacterium]|nr:MAG: long-chain-fatty-acid--CoA ligase [Syntrophobacterales bacterium]
MNVAANVEKMCREYADKVCIVEGDHRLTFRQVEERASQLARYLVGIGVNPGDRVAIFQVNCFQFAEMVYAIEKIGAIIVTLNFRLKGEETKYILNNSEAKVLIVGDRYVEMIHSIRSETPSLEHVLCMGEDKPGTENYEATLSSQSKEPFSPVPRDDDDGACIIYTSGTTGLPKGAVITNANLIVSLNNTDAVGPETGLINVPMYHIAGISSIMIPLYRGDTLIILPAFDPGVFLEIVEKEKVNTTYLVPTMLQAGLDHPDFEKRDTTSLTRIGYGASPMPLNLLLRAKQVLNADFTNYFGMTETTGIVSVLEPEDHNLEGDTETIEKKTRRLSGIGHAIEGSEARIFDDNDQELPRGEVGQIVARGPRVMKGYWGNEKATAETMKGGWLHTGDLASMDEDGYMYLSGRKKDMIIRGGENIYPVEIEAVLHKHPEVEEAAVIGVPDEYWGEIVKAVLVLKKGAQTTEKEIIAYCRDRVASYKKPTVVEFRDSLPKNAMQKVLKTVLREEATRKM